MNSTKFSEKYLRSEGIDLARGFAMLAMIFYHFCWDLGEFGILDRDSVNSGAWRVFAQLIGSSFLFISGMSFWLYYSCGGNKRKFVSRIIKLIAASLCVSIATFYAYGDYFIFFGILHLLTACTFLAVILVRLPISTLVICAIFVGSFGHYFTYDFFGTRYFAWSGLYSGSIGTVDFYPFFPWACPYIIGIIFAKIIYQEDSFHRVKILKTLLDTCSYIISEVFRRAQKVRHFLIIRKSSKKILIFFSSYSLYIYLIHQPVLFAIIFLVLEF